MRKKIIGAVLLLLSAITCAVGAGCADKHTHTYSTKWRCDEENHWHQADCGHEDETSAKSEHTWNTELIKSATHKEDGLAKQTCAICGYEKSIVVPASTDAHTFSEEWSKDKIAHWHSAVCEHSSVITDRAEHTGEWEVAIERDCEQDGLNTFTCTVCGYTEEKVIPATGHMFSEGWDFNDNSHWHKAVCEHENLRDNEGPHNFVNGICSDCGFYNGPHVEYALSKDETSYIVVGEGTFTEGVLAIPAEYNGKPVTSVAENAFFGSKIQEIVLPYGVTSIGKNAFYGCTALKSVYLPDSVEYIGSNAFFNCVMLQSINIPFKIKEISDAAFYKCKSLSNVVLIGSNVTKIGKAAFAWCSELSKINIPYSVQSIGDSAFSECSKLKELDFPNSLTEIGAGAFFNCALLSNVVLPKNLTRINKNLFNYCTSLESVIIPDGVETIGDFAFSECRSLKGIAFPRSVTDLGVAAFANCSAIKKVVVDGNITKIGDNAFDGCNQIDTVYMPSQASVFNYLLKDNIRTVVITSGNSISATQFNGCYALESITISDSVTRIESGAFDECDNVKFATLPSFAINFVSKTNLRTVTITRGEYIETYIEDNAFADSTYLETITLPANTKAIGSNAFDGCYNLSKINYAGDIAGWCKISGLNNIMTSTRTLQIDGEELTGALIIPDGVTSISDYAFAYCNNITSVAIPDSVTNIGSNAFDGCENVRIATLPVFALNYISKTNLRAVTITSGTYIYSNVFDNCTYLETITLPAEMKMIEIWSFEECNNLTKVYYDGDIAGWCEISGLGNIMSSSRTLYIGGEELVGKLTIPDGVTSISDYAFAYCANITSVVIPDSVTYIGSSAFDGCENLARINYVGYIAGWCEISGLKNIVSSSRTLYLRGQEIVGKLTIPDGVTSISDYAFAYCANITSVVIPDSVTYIGSSAFDGCENIRTATLPSSAISYISKTNLRTVTITSGTHIVGNAFANSSYLETITLPSEMQSIGSYAFDGCYNLSKINYAGDIAGWCEISGLNNIMSSSRTLYIDGAELTGRLIIPDGVTSISDYAFAYCNNITSVVVPDSVKNIGSYAFANCAYIGTVYYGGTAEEWANISIGYNNRSLTNATRYYYSETEPIESGNFWHYVDGEILVW